MSQNSALETIDAVFIDGQKFNVRADEELETYGSYDRKSYETIFLGNGETQQKAKFEPSGCKFTLSCNDAEEIDNVKEIFSDATVSKQVRIQFADGKSVNFSAKRTETLEVQMNYAYITVTLAYDSDIIVNNP